MDKLGDSTVQSTVIIWDHRRLGIYGEEKNTDSGAAPRNTRDTSGLCAVNVVQKSLFNSVLRQWSQGNVCSVA